MNKVYELITEFDLTELAPHRNILEGVQSVHDEHEVADWEEAFRDIAEMNGVQYK